MNVETSRFLEHIADVLDIPDDLYEEAVAKYTDLGEWLERKDAAMHRSPPEIYPQGSFRLGTMIRPISDSDEYDIDLVYRRDLQKESTSQQQLKTEAGEHLADYVEDTQRKGDESISLTESRRSWKLQYPDRFHMDVLPAIPDANGRANAILITDKELTRWQFSNPMDYAEWFKTRMIARFMEKRAAMAQAIKASVEDVPAWKVKTALQRAVQILKRHRDIRFQDDPHDVKPASIIISTLAAKAYDNEADLATAMTKLVRDMPNHIERRQGVYWVANPVNPDENFADRWIDRPDRAEAFFAWLDAVKSDLAALDATRDFGVVGERLKASFGEGIVNEALNRPGALVKLASASTSEVPPLADFRHVEEPKWPISQSHKASVRGSVHKERYEQKKLWELSRRSVPKGIGLRFVLKTNVPKPYNVHWQVVNTGAEASSVNCLRGDFYEGSNDDGSVRWEETAYRGTHWVEAFVVKDGVCVARSGRTYVKVR